MKLFTVEQMRQADNRAEAAGITTGELMEAAGAAVAERLVQLFPAVAKVLILCGKGNNGGDGYVTARRLADRPVVQVLELSSEPTTPAATEARAALIASGSNPQPLDPDSLRAWLEEVRHDEDEGRELAQGSDVVAAAGSRVIVDALLGSGLDRPLRSELVELVELVNGSGLPVLAIDVPTGINADSPVPPGVHLQAFATVQLAGAKLASCFYPARAAYAADLSRPESADAVADIGIPEALLDELSDVTILADELCRGYLPSRPADAHKYVAGTVTVVAGSPRYLGAAELCCRGAWRGGAGLVTLLGAERYAGAWPESIYLQRPEAEASPDPLHSGSEAVSSAPAWPPEGLEPRHAAATVVGPGLDTNSLWLLDPLFAWAPGALIVDATALEPTALWPALAAAPESLSARMVLTPHAGEAARLLSGTGRRSADDERGAADGGFTVANVTADPLGSARELAAISGAIVVLKGSTTVVAAPGGELAVSCRGHPGMAAGGTGDVLAGLIGALGATAESQQALFERTCLAVFVHGTAGETAAKKAGNALIASDLVAEIGPALLGLGWGA